MKEYKDRYRTNIDPDFDDTPIPSVGELMAVHYGAEPSHEAIPVGVPLDYGAWQRVEGEILMNGMEHGSNYGLIYPDERLYHGSS